MFQWENCVHPLCNENPPKPIAHLLQRLRGHEGSVAHKIILFFENIC